MIRGVQPWSLDILSIFGVFLFCTPDFSERLIDHPGPGLDTTGENKQKKDFAFSDKVQSHFGLKKLNSAAVCADGRHTPSGFLLCFCHLMVLLASS